VSAVIDVVVPTIEGREASLERCISSLRRTSSVELNVIVVNESRTCGWGWRQGLVASRADYILLACDDQEAASAEWAEKCIETVDAGRLPCPRVWRPDGSIESNGGDMKLMHHVNPRPQKDGTEVDYTTIPFMSSEQAEQIGMIDVHYASDVWVSYRGRQFGYPTVLRHGFDVIHHGEQVGRGAGMSQIARDEMDCKTMAAELERVGKNPQPIKA
jgi:hypothetical protein